jgi:signal transduction histidine kinase
MGDSVMLYQAFLNILINSVQAMHGGGDIHVRVASSNHTVTVVFEDQGSGIPEDLLEKIWDPFFTTKEKGTGLGLVIVKNIIESHQGRIRIENRPAGGAQVKIDLPAS